MDGIQWFKTLNPSISLDYYQLTQSIEKVPCLKTVRWSLPNHFAYVMKPALQDDTLGLLEGGSGEWGIGPDVKAAGF